MEQDIIRPQSTPKLSSQAFSPLGCTLASVGAALLTLCLLGASAAATAWALSRLLGLPDVFMYGLLMLLMIFVVIASIWVGGRAWSVERTLARGADVHPPVFKLGYYFKPH